MHPLLETHLRARIRHYLGAEEEGIAELVLVALVAFVIGLLVSGRRIIVQ